jgi:hypothetical protein
MQRKNSHSKETDITGILVVALFVMLGILFVTFSNTLTKKTTSTSTRASEAKAIMAESTKCDVDGTQTWWGKKIECAVEKIDGQCPSTNPVTDSTHWFGKLICHTNSSMDIYFNMVFERTGRSPGKDVKRGNQYCIDNTENNGAKCLVKKFTNNLDWDLNNDKWRNNAYSGYIEYKSKLGNISCPVLIKDISIFHSDSVSATVETGSCYVPGP